jgi:hypothetical protein
MYEIDLNNNDIITYDDNDKIKRHIVRIILGSNNVIVESYIYSNNEKKYEFIDISKLPQDIKEFIKNKFSELFI